MRQSQFKTMKYRPEFPQRFGCIEHARAHCQAFFAWYNAQHCHSSIAYMTPHSVHCGLATDMLDDPSECNRGAGKVDAKGAYQRSVVRAKAG